MYSTLMVYLDIDHENANLLNIAADLSERFDAHVLGIASCQPAQLVGDGSFTTEFIARDRAEIAERMKTTRDAFDAALEKRSPVREWRSAVTFGPPTDFIACQGRRADLVIIGVEYRGSWFDPSWRVDTSDLIMQVGRPVLVVPNGVKTLSAGTVLVGWKDTRESRRAVMDALPFLQTAEKVIVVEVVASRDQIDAAKRNVNDVSDWLDRHGVSSHPMAIATDDGAEVDLCAVAQDQGADLVVAGAYGHSRLHEWMLGGVTRNLLQNPVRCVLLSH
ncbi:MAG: universal stress protein [Rudaea sp.]